MRDGIRYEKENRNRKVAKKMESDGMVKRERNRRRGLRNKLTREIMEENKRVEKQKMLTRYRVEEDDGEEEDEGEDGDEGRVKTTGRGKMSERIDISVPFPYKDALDPSSVSSISGFASGKRENPLLFLSSSHLLQKKKKKRIERKKHSSIRLSVSEQQL